MTVNNILRRKGGNVITTTPSSSMEEAIQSLVSNGVGSLLVVNEENKVVGIITERDILRASARHFDDLGGRQVSEFMSRDVIIGCVGDSLAYVERVMTESRVRHLPIYDGKTLAGLISIGDVVKSMVEQAEGEVRHLTEYIAGSYPG